MTIIRQAKVAGNKPAPAKTNTDAPDAKTAECLSPQEKNRLAALEALIRDEDQQIKKTEEHTSSGMMKIAEALHEIRDKKLYREGHGSFKSYVRKQLRYERAHANRLAEWGALRAAYPADQVSPRGDIVRKIQSEAVARPLLNSKNKESVLDTLVRWFKFQPNACLTAKLVKAAVAVAKNHPDAQEEQLTSPEKRFIQDLNSVIDLELEKTNVRDREVVNTALCSVLAVMREKRSEKSTTGIAWTNHTWNPLVGCSPISAGCLNCYAAELCGTRMATSCGHLVKRREDRYVFNDQIAFYPERLAEPLLNRAPGKYFVNSMSDLFHKEVPDEFVSEVFRVMEKAHWHIFQVLTKRPERMAEFTAKYWKDKTPPENIWLGTSTEDQKAFDERLPHLEQTVAAVRWISVEPLISAINMADLEGVDWVVVGGESGKNVRKMEAGWVREIRDACKKAKVPFFFKQWGVYGEDGEKVKMGKKKGDGITQLPTIDGKSHGEYPGHYVQKEDTQPEDITDGDLKQKEAA